MILTKNILPGDIVEFEYLGGEKKCPNFPYGTLRLPVLEEDGVLICKIRSAKWRIDQLPNVKVVGNIKDNPEIITN